MGHLWRFLAGGAEPISDLSMDAPTIPLLNSAWTELQPQCLGRCSTITKSVMGPHGSAGTRGKYPPAHIHASGRDSAATASAGKSSLWEDLAMLCTVTFPCAAAMQRGTKGTSLPLQMCFRGPRQLPLSTPSQWTPQFSGEGACTSLGYHTYRGWVMMFPKNTCSLVNPGSAYLKGHIRQLAYLL